LLVEALIKKRGIGGGGHLVSLVAFKLDDQCLNQAGQLIFALPVPYEKTGMNKELAWVT